MIKTICSLLCLLLLLHGKTAQAASPGDLGAGKARAQAICQTCHGMDGRGTMPMVANIGGQQQDYLILQLENYRDGKRRHEQMSIIAKMLSDEDIANLAKWYSSIRMRLELPE